MTDPGWFRRALLASVLAKPIAPLFDLVGLKPIAAMIRLAPLRSPRNAAVKSAPAARQGPRRGRVGLLSGCVASVLSPHVNAAAIRVLTRHGYEVVVAPGEGCCGAFAHHMGQETDARTAARRNIDAWTVEIEREGLDAILTTAAGCGTTVKDYGYMLRSDPAYAAKAAAISQITQDISEFICNIRYLKHVMRPAAKVAYQPPCSLAHGQRVSSGPKEMLARAGFEVKEVPDAHLCCGSAGTYNILQPDLANRLRDRKIAYIERTSPT